MVTQHFEESMANNISLKTIKRKLRISRNRKVLDLSDVPLKYKSLAKKIIKSAPVWGNHQTIEFPDGFVLKGGRNQVRIDMFNLPLNLESYSVLDIGCNIGAIPIECKKRNAKRVVGLDKDKNLIECAIEIAKFFDFDIEYNALDVAKEEMSESFDYVFFLNVFHHLDEKSKINMLRNVDRITMKQLFFEAPIKGDIISKTYLTTEDYLSYFRGFTTFTNVIVIGYSDFNRPILLCER